MNFLFACSGTAGHVNPALAIASEIRRREAGAGLLFIGAGREIENRLIPQAGYELVNIKMSGLQRSLTPKNLAKNAGAVKNLITGSREAGRIIREFCPDAVIGTGGYICYPVLKKASSFHIPAFIHESNAEPGLTTKLLSTIVKNVFTAFPELEHMYRSPERVLFTGTPVMSGFKSARQADKPIDGISRAQTGFDKPKEQEQQGKTPNRKPLVVSFWGSLGAELMNELMVDFIKLNIREGSFDHIHAAGKKGSAVKITERASQYGNAGGLPPGIEIREYIDDMPTLMANADLVLCRAGGSTLAELTAMRKPAVLVPSPYVTNNQQVKNSGYLQRAGAAVVLAEKDCTGESLYRTVTSLLEDKEKLNAMSGSLEMLSADNAESIIVDKVFDSISKAV